MSATEAVVKTPSESVRRGKPKQASLNVVSESQVQARDIVQDPSRDAFLTEFGKKTLEDRYLLPGESFQDMFARVSAAYADNLEHAQRLY
ncbi:MAG: ribonucleotide reductase N-terminal alpha domain-containing protein, partial [Pseudomonadota bacterium]